MRAFVIAVLLAASTIVALAADPLPRSKGRVSDYTGTLSSQEVERVASNLKVLEDKAQVGILIVDHIDREISDWTIDVFKAWGIGQKSRDNGMLLVMVKKTSQLRLEVGAGLDGIFPDQSAKVVLEQVREKLPSYFNAAIAGTVAIRTALAGKERVGAYTQENDMTLGAWLIIGGFALIVAVVFFSWRRKKKEETDRVASDPWQYDDRSSSDTMAATIGAASVGGYAGAGVAASSAAWRQNQANDALRYKQNVEAENDRRRRDEEDERRRRHSGGGGIGSFAAGALAGVVVDELLHSSSHKSDNAVSWGGGDSSGAGASDSGSDSGGDSGGGGGD